MRTAIRRNCSGGVVRIPQRREGVMDERMIDEVNGTAHYTHDSGSSGSAFEYEIRDTAHAA